MLEKAMATQSSVLAWRIPGREPDGLPTMGSHRVGHDRCDAAADPDVIRLLIWFKHGNL